MTKMSEITEAHDPTSEIGSPPPTPEQMKQWLSELEEAIAVIKQEKKASQKAMKAAITAPRG